MIKFCIFEEGNEIIPFINTIYLYSIKLNLGLSFKKEKVSVF